MVGTSSHRHAGNQSCHARQSPKTMKNEITETLRELSHFNAQQYVDGF